MMDFGWAALYFLWFELLSLPLRLVLARTRAPEDVRRFLSRVAGPVVLVLPIWYAGHVTAFATWHGFGLAWIGLALAGGVWYARRAGGLTRGLGYDWLGSGPQGKLRRTAGQLAPELFAFALFMGFIAFRRWVPEMTFEIGASAAEKFGNAMMFWSTWHGRGLPPEDYWLAGEPLTYYYWGHFHWSWIGRMGGFPAELALNLALARTTVLVFEGAWLLGRAMGLRAGWASVGALAATWGGNPEALKQAWRVWSVPNVPYQWGGYDFWKPSRAIENVVDEFPAFSAILGDFHAHHLALPWFLGWLAILVAGRRWGWRVDLFRRWPGTGNPSMFAIWTLVWGALGLAAVLSNLWNLPLIVCAVGLWVVLSLGGGWRRCTAAVLLSVALGIVLMASNRLLRGGASLPLPAAGSQGFWEKLPIKPVPPELQSAFVDLFDLWGLPLVVIGIAIILRICHRSNRWVVGLGVASALLILVASPAVPWTPPAGIAWVWGGMICGVLALGWGGRPRLTKPATAAIIGGFLVLAGLELFYVQDRFVGKLARYNSYFKFSYPLWIIFWMGAAQAAHGIWTLRWPWPPLLVVRSALVLLLVAAFVYPVCAMPARIIAAKRGDRSPRRPTLNGYDFVRNRPNWATDSGWRDWIRKNYRSAEVVAEADMLAWIREHVPPGDCVAEAAWPGGYHYGGRVASLGGRPIPLGWPHHEQQWRGPQAFKQIEQRRVAVDRFYRGQVDPKDQEARGLSPVQRMRRQAAALGIDWALFGIIEAKQYGPEALERLRDAAPLAAEFPEWNPRFFLFDFRPDDSKIKHP